MFLTVSFIIRVNMVRGRVDLLIICTKLQSWIRAGMACVIAVIRSFETLRSFRYALECVAYDGILLICINAASGMTRRFKLNWKSQV